VSAPVVGACGDTIKVSASGRSRPLVCIEISDGDTANVYLTPGLAIKHIENVRAALAKIGVSV
jgi:hypothetical protein